MAKVLLEERQVTSAHEVAERRAARRRDALRSVLDHPKGRLFIAALIADCGPLVGGFVADPMRLQFDAGERNVGLRLIAECIRDAPISYRLLEQETAQRAAADAREDESLDKASADAEEATHD